MIDIPDFLHSIRVHGYVRRAGSFDEGAYRSFVGRLGRIVNEERIALRPGAHAYVAKPGPVPMHTDHPEARFVAWLCLRQDEVAGGSRLYDSRPFLQSLSGEEVEQLRHTELECPPLAGGPPTLRFPVLTASPHSEVDEIFCSPWLRAAGGNQERQAILDGFRSRLSHDIQARAFEERLVEGEMLIIDNRRVLHGRGAIDDRSRRELLRFWLQ
jgi:alpha-ketoglutarate-dependent taurine dioxygenase